VLNGIAQVLFDGTVPSCVNRSSIQLTSQLGTRTARIVEYQAAGNAARYKTNSLPKGRLTSKLSVAVASLSAPSAALNHQQHETLR